MTMASQRSAACRPGWMESHLGRRAPARQYCVLDEIDPEDLPWTLYDTIHGSEHRPLAHADEVTFKLHLEFVHAHGAPQGEFTTFSSAAATIPATPGAHQAAPLAMARSADT